MALIERLPGVEAIIIPAGNGATPVFSRGAKAYIVRPQERVEPGGK